MLDRQKGLTNHPTAGSFVRPTRPFDSPNSFVEAIRLKYASEGDGAPACASRTQDIRGEAIHIGGKEVEEVGFDKIRAEMSNLQALRIVILDSLCVSRPGARKTATSLEGVDAESGYTLDVENTSPKIVELDLSRNLIEEWDEIIDVCRQLPELRSLKVDGNRFRSVSSSVLNISLNARPFASLRSLGLDNTLLSWDQVCRRPR